MLSVRILLVVLLFSSFSTVLLAQQTVEDPPALDQQSRQSPAADQDESQSPDPPKPDSDRHSGSDDQEDSPEEPNSTKKTRSRKWTNTKRSEEFIAVFVPVVASTTDAVVKIKGDNKQIALGTVVGSEGFVLTKASELRGELTCEFSNGDKLKPSIVGVDPKTDLVLLKVDKTGLTAAPINSDTQPTIGSWLATVSQDDVPLTVGIVSHDVRPIKNRAPNSAIIGIEPAEREEGEGVRINRISSDSPAEQAGLLINDVIIELDGDSILNREQLLERLSHYHPGDEIVLIILRGKEEIEIPVTLGKRSINPMRDRGVQQNQMGSTLSNRRSNFPLAMQHDSTLNANECGGPVVDLSGRVVGINIARAGRVSSLALPMDVVVPVIARLKTGKFVPNIVNKQEIKRVEKEIAQLENDFDSLPKEKMNWELGLSAGTATEKELKRQVDETKQRLKELQSRYYEQKKQNRDVSDSIADVDKKQNSIERKREPLQQELKYLTTGVK